MSWPGRMHITAVQLQRSQKKRKMIARQADRMGGGGRGCLAGIVWMNLDRAAGRGCQIRAVSGSDVLVEGQRPVDQQSVLCQSPSVRPSAHTDADTDTQSGG